MGQKISQFLGDFIKPEPFSKLTGLNTQITYKRLLIEAGLVYLVFTFLATVLLFYFPFYFIDLEELEYGDLPVALIDQEITFGNLGQFQTMQREGSIIIFGLPVAVIFGLFGPSLWALKFAGVLLSGLWAAFWYAVARLAFPSLSAIYGALLFAIPLPLIQLSNLSITSIMTHLGVSTWHGVSLLLILFAFRAKTGRKSLLFFLSGLLCGLGIYSGYGLIPLVPGILWLAWKRGGKQFIKPWLAGIVPGLVLVISFFSTENLASVKTESNDSAFYLLTLVKRILVYGAGFVRLSDGAHGRQVLSLSSSGEGMTFFSQLGVVCSLLIAVLVMVYIYWRIKQPEDKTTRPDLMVLSLEISFVGYFLALYVTQYELYLYAFDGLRYLIPLVPIITLLILELVRPLASAYRNIAIGLMVMLNLTGFFIIGYPFAAENRLGDLKGYSTILVRNVVSKDSPTKSEVRQIQNAFWFGVASAEREVLLDHFFEQHLGETGNSIAWGNHMHYLEDNNYSEEAKNEYWRGVGYGLAVLEDCSGDDICALEQAPEEIKHLMWQGAAILLVCDKDAELLLSNVPAGLRADVLWGLGRGQNWNPYRENLPEDITTHPNFLQGQAEGWVLDYTIHHPAKATYNYKQYKNFTVYGTFCGYGFSTVPGSRQ